MPSWRCLTPSAVTRPRRSRPCGRPRSSAVGGGRAPRRRHDMAGGPPRASPTASPPRAAPRWWVSPPCRPRPRRQGRGGCRRGQRPAARCGPRGPGPRPPPRGRRPGTPTSTWTCSAARAPHLCRTRCPATRGSRRRRRGGRCRSSATRRAPPPETRWTSRRQRWRRWSARCTTGPSSPRAPPTRRPAGLPRGGTWRRPPRRGKNSWRGRRRASWRTAPNSRRSAKPAAPGRPAAARPA
mmetsp:Transcript_5662/g.15380  ORF Transcript_5662/g.15380 Transcript_5662/m.15380 type:complete len:239 (-) Transcript_5662:132-848(-)